MFRVTKSSQKRSRKKPTLVERLRAYERKLISTALRKHKGSPKWAAHELGVNRPGGNATGQERGDQSVLL